MESLINPDTGIFNRGKHEGESIESVAIADCDYLLFLYETGNIGGEDIQVLEYFFEDNPDLFPEL